MPVLRKNVLHAGAYHGDELASGGWRATAGASKKLDCNIRVSNIRCERLCDHVPYEKVGIISALHVHMRMCL